MKSLNFFHSNKLFIGILSWLLFLQSQTVLSQLNPGSENIVDVNTIPLGWSVHSTSGALNTTKVSATPRSGSNAIVVSIGSGSAGAIGTTKYQHDDYSVVVPGAGFNVHVIGWLSSTNTHNNDRVALGIKRITGTVTTSENTPADLATAYSRSTRTWTNPGAGTYVPLFVGSSTTSSGASTRNMRGDDFIIYYSTQASPDLTKPNAPTALCVNSTGNNNVITWSDGTDNATNTSGIDGVLILRAPAGTALPTVLDQAYYSTNSLIGPNTIGSWTVLHNGASIGSFTDVDAAGTPYIYAVYMRDVAFNYTTTPATYTTANAGADQILACSVTSTNLVAVAATGGIWSVIAGSGNISNSSLNTSNVSSMPIGSNTFQWTVTNGGCSTFDAVNIYVSNGISIVGNPLNDTVYNQQGNASFGVGLNPPVGSSYQWQVSTNGGSTWSNLSNGGFYSGVTTSVLQITNPTYAMNGYQYRCSVSNACASDISPEASLAVIPITTFSNTSVQACGTNFTNTFGNFTRNIVVSGLPSPLGNLTGQYVLRQVDLQLGNTSCKKDLSTYRARIISPNGTIIELFDNTSGTFTNSDVWINTKFRDHESLERFTQYTSFVQENYHPYSIGYYAIQTDGAFSSVNGENPNGTWVLQIIENVATGNEISFERVQLHFGPKFSINNITTSTSNDICANATCISTQEIIVGTNNGYNSTDPLFMGTTTDGCLWNGANNNSAWFKFVASQSTAYLTLSGIRAAVTGQDDTQPLVFSMTNPCISGFSVPTGGCPNDEARNNGAYLTTNGGGISSSGNVYSNGITANAEFNLSGLTVGQTYYLYVDGNGGGSSTFYIEALFGCETCNTPLPVEWLSFEALKNNRVSDLYWSTASETNNDYFEVQRSVDTENWEKIGQVAGAGNTSYQMDYMFTDVNPYIGINYYRIKQVDYDGNSSYSDIRAVSFTGEMMLVPNPSNGNFTVVGMPENTTNSLQLINSLGQVISIVEIHAASYSFADLNLASGIYYLTINSQETIKVVVTKSN